MYNVNDFREGKVLVTLSEISKFLDNVEITCGCWNWTGYTDANGYGRASIKSLSIHCHVISYVIHNGAIPDKLHVLHSCDNPSCVNPEHLWLGTHQENMKDRNDKGRCGRSGLFGEKINSAKLTALQAKEIRECVSMGAKQIDMAKRFGLSRGTINSLIKGKTWKQAI